MSNCNRSLLPFALALAIVLSVAVYGGLSRATVVAAGEDHAPGVTVTSATASALHFTVRPGDVVVDADGVVSAPGLNGMDQPAGAPALPIYTTLIAVPPAAEVAVDVAVDGAGTRRAVDTVRAGPTGVRPAAEDGMITSKELAFVHEPDPARYATDADFPAALYTVSEPMYYRDQRVVRLTVHPVRYNPARRILWTAEALDVTVTFLGGRFSDLRPLPGEDGARSAVLGETLLNPGQAAAWRDAPPAELAQGGLTMPVGSDAYRIEVSADGVYDVSYADLQAAGMDVGAVDPGTFTLVYRGQPVAYTFVGDADATFEPGEAVRFYGWAFDGSRLERQYITNNAYYLWAGGAATTMSSAANITGFTLRTSFEESITAEEELEWFATWTNLWPIFPNEPDAIFWDSLTKTTASSVTKSFDVTLFDPALAGADATYTVEFMSRSHPVIGGMHHPHDLTVAWDNNPVYSASDQWFGISNRNVTGTLPIVELVNGANRFNVTMSTTTDATHSATVYVNRVTVDYTRQATAVGDQLIIRDDGGQRTYAVSGFTEGSAGQTIIWNISNPLAPVAIPLSPGDVTGVIGNYTYTFGADDAGDAAFIATTAGQVMSPLSVTQYNVTDLDPAGGAQWVAISHADFMTETTTLAAHRASAAYGGYSTHVVDVADILEQYGWGLPVPDAINAYLQHALNAWSTPPSYVTLIGDATTNPRQLPLENFGSGDAPLVPTHLVFVDRFQGQIPSDTNLAFLVGNDVLPDIALARIPAQTVAEAAAMITKIIQFESNQFAPAPWMDHILFVSDDDDAGGNFCDENNTTSGVLASNFITKNLCLANPTTPETTALSDAMYDSINITGTLILNYRGHGSVTGWASPHITNSSQTARWSNAGRPGVILSADCLDGYFTVPGTSGLGEAFFKIDGAGSAAHWSSSGLGFSFEHTILHEGFYEGLFDAGLVTIGDLVNYAKTRYVNLGIGDTSEVEAFTLLGDAAMALMRPDLAVTHDTPPTTASPAEFVSFPIQVTNNGVYPTTAVLTDTLETGFIYESVTASVNIDVTVNGNEIVITLLEPLGRGESALITLTAQVSPGVNNTVLTNTAVVSGDGLDLDAADQTTTADVTVGSCGAGAVVAPAVGVVGSGNDVSLSWSDNAANIYGYEVWRHTAPYFMPGDSGSVLLDTGVFTDFVDAGKIGQTADNYFYVVRAAHCNAGLAADSNRTGEFDFAIAPGTP